MKILPRLSHENARAYAVRVLLYNIVNLELVPGSSISENELSIALSLSRTPIREALIELSRLELVEILHNVGAMSQKSAMNKLRNPASSALSWKRLF